MINLCIITAKFWKKHFPTFKICVDTSKEEVNYGNYQDFSKQENNAILFCACKHREGSDIKNLDCCIFLDKVENTNKNIAENTLSELKTDLEHLADEAKNKDKALMNLMKDLASVQEVTIIDQATFEY